MCAVPQHQALGTKRSDREIDGCVPQGEDHMDDGSICGSPQVFEIVAEEHALQRELCDLLESIADGLPHEFDTARACVAISLLQGSVPEHTRLEEEALFPILLRRLSENHPVARTLRFLEQDHHREAALVVEVTDALNTASNSRHDVNMEALGYLLRGLFDVLRRHIDFEDQVVMPVAREVLTPQDLAAIQQWIMRSGHPRCYKQSLRTLRGVRSPDELCGSCPSSVTQRSETEH